MLTCCTICPTICDGILSTVPDLLLLDVTSSVLGIETVGDMMAEGSEWRLVSALRTSPSKGTHTLAHVPRHRHTTFAPRSA